MGSKQVHEPSGRRGEGVPWAPVSGVRGYRSHTQFVDGRPFPKERPRFVNNHTYTPKKTVDAEALLASHYTGPLYPKDVLLQVEFIFTLDGTAITLTPIDVEKSKLRGDLDNYFKLAGDALNGVAYEDDSQIHRMLAGKL